MERSANTSSPSRDIRAFRMSRRHSASHIPSSSDNTTPVQDVLISDEQMNNKIESNIPVSFSRMSRRNSASVNCANSTVDNDNKCNKNNDLISTYSSKRINLRMVTRTNPHVAAPMEGNEKTEAPNDRESATGTTRKSRYPSSPFRRRKSNVCPQGLLPTVAPSLHQRQLDTPSRRVSDKAIDNDEVPIKPERSVSNPNMDDIISVNTNIDQVSDELRGISPIKRRRTPSRSPSASLRNGLPSVRESLKSSISEDGSDLLSPLCSESRIQQPGLLQRRNSMLPRKTEWSSGEKRLSFGTTSEDSTDFKIMHREPPETPISEDERHSYYYSKEDLEKFERDRQLTLLHFRSQRDKGIAWEEGEYSLRGLEEYVFTAKVKSRRIVRKEHLQAVLTEQTRLRGTETSSDVIEDSIRLVSLHFSKRDRTRALSLAAKDSKEAGHNLSGRQLIMKKFKSLSKRSLFRAGGMEMSDSRRSLISDSRRSLMSDESSKMSTASNATTSEDNSKCSSPARNISPIKGRAIGAQSSQNQFPCEIVEAAVVTTSKVVQSSTEQAYAAARNQLRRPTLTRPSLASTK